MQRLIRADKYLGSLLPPCVTNLKYTRLTTRWNQTESQNSCQTNFVHLHYLRILMKLGLGQYLAKVDILKYTTMN